MSKYALLGGTPIIIQDSVLVQLVRLVDRTPPTCRLRGQPVVYSDRLFLKALLIMIVRRLHITWANCWQCSKNPSRDATEAR